MDLYTIPNSRCEYSPKKSIVRNKRKNVINFLTNTTPVASADGFLHDF